MVSNQHETTHCRFPCEEFFQPGGHKPKGKLGGYFKGNQNKLITFDTHHLLAGSEPTGSGQGISHPWGIVEGVLELLRKGLFPGGILHHGDVLQIPLGSSFDRCG